MAKIDLNYIRKKFMIKIKDPIGRRLLRTIIMISTFFSIIATGVQLYIEYRGETEQIHKELKEVSGSALESLSLSLWRQNDDQVTIQLKSLLKLHHITFARIEEGAVPSFVFGTDLAEDSIEKKYELSYMYNNKKYVLGILTLQVGLEYVREQVKKKFYIIAITQTAKTFIVAFIMLYIFSYMITRHLYKIVEYSRGILEGKKYSPLKLDLKTTEDEFGLLQETLNILHRALYQKLEGSEQKNIALRDINLNLQKRIELQDDKDNVFVLKENIKEIRNVLEFIKFDCSEKEGIPEIKRDLKSLEILLDRAFKDE